jgi:hypothetical protein
MTGLPTFAATLRILCRNCKTMLRQQHGKTPMSGKSAVLPSSQRKCCTMCPTAASAKLQRSD